MNSLVRGQRFESHGCRAVSCGQRCCMTATCLHGCIRWAHVQQHSFPSRRELDYPKNLLTRASGSARWQQGNTDVLAAVHGPQPAFQRKAQADRAVVEVVLRPYSGMPGQRTLMTRLLMCPFTHLDYQRRAPVHPRAGNRQHLYETVIRQTVEACAILSPLPQSSISIVLQVWFTCQLAAHGY